MKKMISVALVSLSLTMGGGMLLAGMTSSTTNGYQDITYFCRGGCSCSSGCGCGGYAIP